MVTGLCCVRVNLRLNNNAAIWIPNRNSKIAFIWLFSNDNYDYIFCLYNQRLTGITWTYSITPINRKVKLTVIDWNRRHNTLTLDKFTHCCIHECICWTSSQKKVFSSYIRFNVFLILNYNNTTILDFLFYSKYFGGCLAWVSFVWFPVCHFIFFLFPLSLYLTI